MKRKSIVIAAAVMLVAASVLGQAILAASTTGGSANCAQRAHQRGAWFAQQLNLTDAQKVQIKTIMQDAKSKAQALRNDSTIPADQKKAQFMEIRKSAHQQIMQVLTPDQQKKMAQLRKEARGTQMKKLAAALNLTADQKAKVKAIREDAKTQIKAVRDDKTLSQDQAKAKVMDIHKASMAQIKQILTPDQLQKLDQIKAQWKQRHHGDGQQARSK